MLRSKDCPTILGCALVEVTVFDPKPWIAWHKYASSIDATPALESGVGDPDERVLLHLQEGPIHVLIIFIWEIIVEKAVSWSQECATGDMQFRIRSVNAIVDCCDIIELELDWGYSDVRLNDCEDSSLVFNVILFDFRVLNPAPHLCFFVLGILDWAVYIMVFDSVIFSMENGWV